MSTTNTVIFALSIVIASTLSFNLASVNAQDSHAVTDQKDQMKAVIAEIRTMNASIVELIAVMTDQQP